MKFLIESLKTNKYAFNVFIKFLERNNVKTEILMKVDFKLILPLIIQFLYENKFVIIFKEDCIEICKYHIVTNKRIFNKIETIKYYENIELIYKNSMLKIIKYIENPF